MHAKLRKKHRSGDRLCVGELLAWRVAPAGQLSLLLKVGRPRNVEHERHAVHLITAPVNEATAHLAEDEHRASAHAPLPAMWGDRCTMPGWSRSLPPKRKRGAREARQVAREGNEEVRRMLESSALLASGEWVDSDGHT